MLRTLSRRLTWPGMLLVAAVLVGTAPGGAADAASQARATAVSTGGGHACALLSDQTVRCWGNNDHGQLGTGTRTRHLTAVAVRGLTDVTAISVGSVSCALISGGGAKCWGPNHDGELGDGTTTDRLTPVAVSGLTDAIAISAGGQHACALLADHTMRCWGVER